MRLLTGVIVSLSEWLAVDANEVIRSVFLAPPHGLLIFLEKGKVNLNLNYFKQFFFPNLLCWDVEQGKTRFVTSVYIFRRGGGGEGDGTNLSFVIIICPLSTLHLTLSALEAVCFGTRRAPPGR